MAFGDTIVEASPPATRTRWQRFLSFENELAAWRRAMDQRPGRVTRDVVGVLAGLLLFAVILSNPPAFVGDSSVNAIGWCAALVLVVVELVGYRRSTVLPAATRMTLPVLAFVLAAIPTANVWQKGEGGFFAIGGLLPWSDALVYYRGAVQFNEEATIDYFNERRPLNAGINGLKLMAGGSLKGWIVTSALSIGIGLLLAGREIARLFGPGAAAAFMGTVAGHAPPYNSTTMSESNGTLLGLLATAILLAAIRLQDRRWFWGGLFVATVALDVRAGAFLTLPFLCLWGALHFGRTRREQLRVAAIGVLVMLLAFLPTRLYGALWGGGEGAAHANFAMTLYGMAAGDKGWRQIYVDHPEIHALITEKAQAEFMYDRSLELIREHPGRFLGSLLRSMWKFVVFLGFFLNQVTMLAIVVLMLCLFRWKHPVWALAAAAFVGTTLSAPFLMWDGGPRVFAATVPTMALIPAMAVGAIEVVLIALLLRRGMGELPLSAGEERSQRVPAVAIGLTFALLAAPLALAGRHPAPRLPTEPALPARATLMFVPGDSGDWLDVFDDRKLARVWVPNVRKTAVLRDLKSLSQFLSVSPDIPLSTPPISIGLAIDTRRKPPFGTLTTWFATPTGLQLPRTRRPLLLAGEEGRMARDERYLLVREIFVLSADGRSWQPYR